MTRQEIIRQLKRYFDIRELVCSHTYQKFGENVSWQFLDTEALHTLLVLRIQILKCGMVINDYIFAGNNEQRGLRCNICPIVKDKTDRNLIYLSAHCNGAGFDVVFGKNTGMTAEKARNLIVEHQHLLPYNIRLEARVTWLHFDTYDTGDKVNFFYSIQNERR